MARQARCPKCKADRITFQVVQTGAVTNTKKKGCLFSIGRALLILCTGGLWLIFGKKKSKSKTSFQNEKIAICQNCGYQWTP